MSTSPGRRWPRGYNDVPPEVYRKFGFPGADDLGNMFQYKRDFNAEFCGPRDVAATRKLNPELHVPLRVTLQPERVAGVSDRDDAGYAAALARELRANLRARSLHPPPIGS